MSYTCLKETINEFIKIMEARIMDIDRYDLMSHSKEELIKLTYKLLDKLPKGERLEFVSKWVNPQAALTESDINKGNGFNGRVETFCKECIEGKYFADPDNDDEYDPYYDYETDYDFSDTEWAYEFSELLKLSVMYSRNKEYGISYSAFDNLMGCLNEAEDDMGILGTDEPMDFIDVEWNEVFDEYYISMRHMLLDNTEFAEKAVDVCMDFRGSCTNSFLNIIDDIAYIEKYINGRIIDRGESWSEQHRLYELLKSSYMKLGLEFDETIVARKLVDCCPNFLNEVALGYMYKEKWLEAIEVIGEGLQAVTDQKILSELKEKLVSCYENAGMYREAFKEANEMFMNYNSHRLYLKARNLAVKIGNLEGYIKSMLKHVETEKRYDYIATKLRIMSFEGYTSRLIDTASKSDIFSRHDYQKYASKSLIYRALGTEEVGQANLNEFLKSIRQKEIEGIVDMILKPISPEDKEDLLRNAIGILKHMVQFHIDAAQRNRYARAAYYCAVIKDIHTYLDDNDEFKKYYDNIIAANYRRSALKDELWKALN